MSPPLGVFRPDMTVAETVEELRELTRAAMITYCYVTDEDGRLGRRGRDARHAARRRPRRGSTTLMLKDAVRLRARRWSSTRR